jgi:DUF4097 and DUF4098 domain-containing protein YvlB
MGGPNRLGTIIKETVVMTLLNKQSIRGLGICAVLGTALFSAAAHAEEYTKTFSISGRASVHVDTNDGAVVVTTGDTKQVEVRVEYLGYELEKSLHIEASQSGDEVNLTARIPNHWHFTLGMRRTLHIEIRMPKNGDLQVKTGDGSIKVGDLAGNVDLHTGDGSLTANAVKGSIHLSTGDGAINASDLDGKCDAVSGDGRIRLSGRFDELRAKSGDGSIDVEARQGSKLGSSWSIRSGDGSIEMAVPSDLGADLDVTTGDGHITSDIPVTVEGIMSKSRVHGKMNGGGQDLIIHTGDGSIHLRRS